MDNHTTQDGATESTTLLAAAIGLLAVAKCPTCDGCGFTVREVGGCDMDGENDTRECAQEQCLWCDEREMIVSEYKANANVHGRSPVQPLVGHSEIGGKP